MARSGYVSLDPKSEKKIELTSKSSGLNDVKSKSTTKITKIPCVDFALDMISQLLTKEMLEKCWPHQVSPCTKPSEFDSIVIDHFTARVPNGIAQLARINNFIKPGEDRSLNGATLLDQLIREAKKHADERTFLFFKPSTRTYLTQRVYELIAAIDSNKFEDFKYLNEDLRKILIELNTLHRWLKDPSYVADPFHIQLRFK